MKRIFSLLVVATVFLISNAYATSRIATFGDQNSSGVYRLTANADSSTSNCASGQTCGWMVFAQDTGIYWPYTTATTTTTLVPAQSGTTIVVTPIQGNTRVNLPAATVGMEYAIVDDAAFSLAVYPATGETINFASLAASAGLINSSTPAKGDSLTLFCSVAGKWSVSNMRNTWVSIAP